MKHTQTELLEHYKGVAGSHLEQAKIEEDLWQLRPASAHRRQEWVASLTGIAQSLVALHSSLLKMPDPFRTTVFDIMDSQQVSWSRMAILLRESRSENYVQGQPLTEEEEDGFFQSLERLGVHFTRVVNRPVEDPQPPAVRATVWSAVRNAIREEFASRLADADPLVVETLQKEFESELQSVIDTYKKKLYRIKRRELSGSGVTRSTARSEVLHACRTLMMDPPPNGKPPDMKKARKMKLKLAKLYHPDHNNGGEVNRPRYEAVIEAYNILTHASEEFGNPTAAPTAN